MELSKAAQSYISEVAHGTPMTVRRARRTPLFSIALLLVSAVLPLASAGAGTDEELREYWRYESHAFEHIRYHQVVDGLRVLDASASRHASNGAVAFTLEHEDLADTSERAGAFLVPEAAALATARQALTVPGPLLDAPRLERVWVQTDDGLRKAYAVSLSPEAKGHFRVVVDGATGAVLEVRDLAWYAEVPARVFRVNPIVGLQDPALQDNPLNLDDGRFAAAMMDVSVNLSGEGFRSDDVIITDALLAPGDELVFDRADPRFLEVMALHYMERAFDAFDRLGYGDLIEDPVRVRAHALPMFGVFPATGPDAYAGNGQVTVFYRAPSLWLEGPDSFQAGTASSGEDADILVHELGHILHAAANPDVEPGWGWIWGEGNGDILAALILEEEHDGFGQDCIFEWLATYYHPSFSFRKDDLLCMRVLDNDLVWPDDQFGPTDEYQWAHENGQFWAGAVWDIYQGIGRDAALTLWIESLFLVPAEMTGFEDMGEALLIADLALTGGTRGTLIREAFAAKGVALSPPPAVEELPTLLEKTPPVRSTKAAPENLTRTAANESPAEESDTTGFVGLGLLAVLGLVALARRRST